MSESRSSSPAGGPGPVRRRALVVDDEAPLVKLVGSYLERGGFEVIVLDLMLPGIDGIEACRRIRAFSDAYIVMLTARVEEIDKIVGLSTGADDYVTKPFSPGELVARIRAMLRRPRTGPADEGAAGALAISRSTRRRARCAGAAIRSS